MERVRVESSQLEEVGHENGVLEVKFKSGHVGQYADVPASLHAELMKAESLGSFFHHNIKTAKDRRWKEKKHDPAFT